jgi:hypothetical protein
MHASNLLTTEVGTALTRVLSMLTLDN